MLYIIYSDVYIIDILFGNIMLCIILPMVAYIPLFENENKKSKKIMQYYFLQKMYS